MKTFIITDKTKRKARRRRQRKEKKWIALRASSWVLGITWVVSFYIAMFKAYNDYTVFSFFNTVQAISGVACAVTIGLLLNFTSHWIQDRLNERIWIENGILYHFIQIAFWGGLNSWSADSTARIYEYGLSTLRNPKYDPKSGRTVFNVDGRMVYYKDYYKKIISHERQINGKLAIFYEYMEPSLYKYLESEGVKFSLETLDFKVFDHHL